MHMQNLVRFHQIILRILSGNAIMISTKGHNSVINLRPLTPNNPNLDTNAYTKFGQIPSIFSQDIGRKRNSDIILGAIALL